MTTYDPLEPLTVFQQIDAINKYVGRQTGPAPGGYVDENGTPIIPDWSGAGEHQVVGRAQGVVDENEAGAVETVVDAASEGGEAAVAPAQVEWNFVMLEAGVGMWRGQQFTLAEGEMMRVRRIVVAAIRRGLREQGRALGAEVAVRKRKPKGGKRASRSREGGEV